MYVDRWMLCAVFAVLLVVSCGPTETTIATPEPSNAEGSAEASAYAPPAMQNSDGCGTCHVEIHAEWQAGYHARAMSDPIFVELWTRDGQKEECVRCHAPIPLWEVDFETPIARHDRRVEGVGCLTCHGAGEEVLGPTPGASGPCRPRFEPAVKDVVKMCFGCHNQHDTGSEWLISPYGPQAREPRERPPLSCLDCHMEAIERPAADGKPARAGRRHGFRGGHDFDLVRDAAHLEVEVERRDEGFRFRVWVTNAGAGHSIPTDSRHRSYDTYVKLWDADGRVILDPLDLFQQTRTQAASYRLQYRNSGLRDTQIPPLARVSTLEGERGFVDVPTARAGRGEAWLVYRMTREDVLEPESLSAPEDFVPWRARVVRRVSFDYGP